ncbi:MAG: hypothetical protein ACYTFI_12290 [Planctomycetota bacterium]
MTDAPAVADQPRSPHRPASMRGGEIIFLLTWPWLLAAVVAIAATGAPAHTGTAAGAVLAAGAAFLALVGAPVLSRACGGAPAERAARCGTIAALAGALALPALVASRFASPSASGTVLCGAAVTALAAYALVQAAAVLGRWYPLAAALWLALPPLVWFVMTDVLGRRVEWLLALGPASAAAWMVTGGSSAWSRFAWPAVVLALAGGALSLLESGRAAPEPQEPASPMA